MIFGSHHDAPVALPDSMRVLSATVRQCFPPTLYHRDGSSTRSQSSARAARVPARLAPTEQTQGGLPKPSKRTVGGDDDHPHDHE